MRKTSRFISVLLAMTVAVGSFPFAMGLTASAAEEPTVDYSAVENQSGLKIDDYFTKLDMYDGAGLNVSNGALVTDGTWADQLKNDADVPTTGAYAVYHVVPGTAFSATFTATTDLNSVKLYVSENGVDWFLADCTKADATVTLAASVDYASYVKVMLPVNATVDDGLVSATFTEAAEEANHKRVDYALNTTADGNHVGSGINDDNCYVRSGVWQSSGNLFHYNSGIIQPAWSNLDAAKTEGSFAGYVVYKVQPGTLFSMNVTGNRSASVIADALGYENPLDWNVKFYGSIDGEDYTPIDVVPVCGARYANNDNTNTRRSMDFNFIVPAETVYVKCQFPQTKTLEGLQDEGGNVVFPYVGNDLFEINKVEYSQIKTDYYQATAGDYYLAGDYSNLDALDIAAINGTLRRTGNGLLDPDWSYQYERWDARAQVTYNVEPGTPFYLGVKPITRSQLTGYIDLRGEFVLQVKGFDDELGAWDNFGDIVVDEDNENDLFYTSVLSAEDNVYTKICIQWPTKASDSYVGNDAMGLAEVIYTPYVKKYETQTYDFTNPSRSGSIADANAEVVHAVSYSTGHMPMVYATGIQADWSYLWARDSGSKASVTWAAYGGQGITYNFFSDENYINFYGNFEVYTSPTLDFATNARFNVTKSEDNYYRCKLTVPEGHNYVRVVLPQDRRYNADVAGNDRFAIQSMTFELIEEVREFNQALGGMTDDINNSTVKAVDWSKQHVPNIYGNGLQGDWGYLWTRTEAGQKPYVTWAVEEGQVVTYAFNQAEYVIPTFGNIKVFTSATMDFANATEYAITKLSDGKYTCQVTVPTGHQYIKVVLPQDKRYSADVAANDLFTVTSMRVKNLPKTVPGADAKQITSIAVTAPTGNSAFGKKMNDAGLSVAVSYDNGEVRTTDCGFTLTGFDRKVGGEQTVTLNYKGFTDTFTVLVNFEIGDVNGDGVISILDLVRLKKVAAQTATVPAGATANINGDADVDATDLSILRNWLLGL